VVAAQLFIKGLASFSVSSSQSNGILDGISLSRRLAVEQRPITIPANAGVGGTSDVSSVATQTDVVIKSYGKAAQSLRGRSSSSLAEDSARRRRGEGGVGNGKSSAGSSILVGIVLNATSIVPDNMALLAELACEHNTESHILASHGAADALEAMRLLMEGHPRSGQCADVAFVQEPSDILEGVNDRVDRIAILRDYQRTILARTRKKGTIPSDDAEESTSAQSGTVAAADKDAGNGVVIVADLDLHSLPSADQITEEANAMIYSGREDIVCAAGVMHHPFGYYDIFA